MSEHTLVKSLIAAQKKTAPNRSRLQETYRNISEPTQVMLPAVSFLLIHVDAFDHSVTSYLQNQPV